MNRKSPFAQQLLHAVRACLLAVAVAFGTIAHAETILLLTGTDPYYSPIIVAAENGYFKDEGLDVSHRMFSSGTDAMLAFRGVNAQFVASGDLPSLALWSEGDAVGVAPYFVSPKNLFGIVKADIKSPKELAGKTIGTRVGSTAEYLLDSYLKKNAIDPKSLKVINLAPPEIVPAMVSGQIDGFFLWRPYPTLAENILGNKIRVLTDAQGYYNETMYLSVNKAFAEKNPEVVKKVIHALQRAVAFINQDPEKSAKFVAAKIKSDPSVALQIFETKPFNMSYTKESAAQLKELADFLAAKGRLKKPVDVNTAVDTKYLRAVDAGLVSN
jgi:ABC-type nitrate/sulfonate/bicarbonate transport system substrate-binding protein